MQCKTSTNDLGILPGSFCFCSTERIRYCRLCGCWTLVFCGRLSLPQLHN